MDESLDDLSAIITNTVVDLSASLANDAIENGHKMPVFNIHGSNNWSKLYKTKQTAKYNSSLHKQTHTVFVYKPADKEDIMGDPITKSFRKSTFTWWDCKLFDKK